MSESTAKENSCSMPVGPVMTIWSPVGLVVAVFRPGSKTGKNSARPWAENKVALLGASSMSASMLSDPTSATVARLGKISVGVGPVGPVVPARPNSRLEKISTRPMPVGPVVPARRSISKVEIFSAGVGSVEAACLNPPPKKIHVRCLWAL